MDNDNYDADDASVTSTGTIVTKKKKADNVKHDDDSETAVTQQELVLASSSSDSSSIVPDDSSHGSNIIDNDDDAVGWQIAIDYERHHHGDAFSSATAAATSTPSVSAAQKKVLQVTADFILCTICARDAMPAAPVHDGEGMIHLLHLCFDRYTREASETPEDNEPEEECPTSGGSHDDAATTLNEAVAACVIITCLQLKDNPRDALEFAQQAVLWDPNNWRLRVFMVKTLQLSSPTTELLRLYDHRRTGSTTTDNGHSSPARPSIQDASLLQLYLLILRDANTTTIAARAKSNDVFMVEKYHHPQCLDNLLQAQRLCRGSEWQARCLQPLVAMEIYHGGRQNQQGDVPRLIQEFMIDVNDDVWKQAVAHQYDCHQQGHEHSDTGQLENKVLGIGTMTAIIESEYVLCTTLLDQGKIEEALLCFVSAERKRLSLLEQGSYTSSGAAKQQSHCYPNDPDCERAGWRYTGQNDASSQEYHNMIFPQRVKVFPRVRNLIKQGRGAMHGDNVNNNSKESNGGVRCMRCSDVPTAPKWCNACQHAVYCSRECQVEDWQTFYHHKPECRRLANMLQRDTELAQWSSENLQLAQAEAASMRALDQHLRPDQLWRQAVAMQKAAQRVDSQEATLYFALAIFMDKRLAFSCNEQDLDLVVAAVETCAKNDLIAQALRMVLPADGVVITHLSVCFLLDVVQGQAARKVLPTYAPDLTRSIDDLDRNQVGLALCFVFAARWISEYSFASGESSFMSSDTMNLGLVTKALRFLNVQRWWTLQLELGESSMRCGAVQDSKYWLSCLRDQLTNVKERDGHLSGQGQRLLKRVSSHLTTVIPKLERGLRLGDVNAVIKEVFSKEDAKREAREKQRAKNRDLKDNGLRIGSVHTWQCRQQSLFDNNI